MQAPGTALGDAFRAGIGGDLRRNAAARPGGAMGRLAGPAAGLDLTWPTADTTSVGLARAAGAREAEGTSGGGMLQSDTGGGAHDAAAAERMAHVRAEEHGGDIA